MGVPTSEVGYTPAMPRREDHEVYKDMWWHWTKKKNMMTNGDDHIWQWHMVGVSLRPLIHA